MEIHVQQKTRCLGVGIIDKDNTGIAYALHSFTREYWSHGFQRRAFRIDLRITFMRGFLVGSLLVAALSTATQVHAKMIDVRMKNNGQGGFMVFEPALIQADVGDTVRFLPVDAGHNAEPINGFLPAGVATTGGQVGKEYQLKLTKPGFYGIKCRPHFALGMVALIKAGRGTAPNEAAIASAISSLPPMAKKRMIALRSIAH